MPRTMRPALVLAIAAAVALALAACGSGSDAKLLPGTTAQEINENLDSVQQLVDERECVAATDAALQVSSEVEALRNIDPGLKQILREGASRLNEVVTTCDEAPEETVEETVPEPESEEEEEPKKKEKKPKKVEPEETLEQEQEEEATEKELPPQAKGEAKGHEKEPPPAKEESGEPSGGIGPASAAEGGG
jgi:outer membrane biosynthesis protein TonB